MFPQITQIDADIILCVDLRHLRADSDEWTKIRNSKSEFRNLWNLASGIWYPSGRAAGYN